MMENIKVLYGFIYQQRWYIFQLNLLQIPGQSAY